MTTLGNRCAWALGLSLGAMLAHPGLLFAQTTPVPDASAEVVAEGLPVPPRVEFAPPGPGSNQASPPPVSPPGPSVSVGPLSQEPTLVNTTQAQPVGDGNVPLPRTYVTPPVSTPSATAPALTSGWSWVDTVASAPTGPAEAPKRNRFRGSRFDWTHNVTTSALGIGQDYQSSSYQVYQQGFSLLMAYFPYDGEMYRLRLAVAPGLDVVLTNSDLTTTEREPLFRDLPLVVGGSVILAMDPDRFTSTILAPTLVVFLPTSKVSWNAGDYLTVSPRVSLSQQLPLFGAGSAALDDVDLWLQLRYDRLFARGATPIDADLNRPAMGNDGRATVSDVLDGSQNASNAFRLDVSVAFSEQLFGHPLTVTLNADYRVAQLDGVDSYQLATATGPVTVEPDPDARTWRRGVGFGADATYQLIPTMSVAVGYAACGNELCPARGVDLGNSTYNTPFYTPHAIFWGGLVFHVDSVLDQLINGDKVNSSVLRRDLATTTVAPRF